MAIIDRLAKVHRKTEVGKDVDIGAFTVIGEHVRIGDGTRIGNNVTIVGHTEIGERNTVYHNVVMGTPPQDLSYAGMETRLVIGDENTFREFVTINVGTEEGGAVTIIGNRNYLMACCHVAHDCALEDDIIMANGCLMAGHTKVESGVVFSGAAAVHHFTTVGTMSFVGGLTRVVHDVPPYMMVEGDSNVPRRVNSRGMRRHGCSDEAIAAVERAYRLIYRSKRLRAEVLEEFELDETLCPEVKRLVTFLRNVDQGKKGRYLESVRMGW